MGTIGRLLSKLMSKRSGGLGVCQPDNTFDCLEQRIVFDAAGHHVLHNTVADIGEAIHDASVLTPVGPHDVVSWNTGNTVETIKHFDAAGHSTGTDYLSQITYNTSGQITSETDNHFNAAGLFTGIDYLSGAAYNTSGQLTGVTDKHFDVAGHYAGTDYLYGMAHNASGQLTAVVENHFDMVGLFSGADNLSGATYDTSGRVTGVTEVHCDAAGHMAGIDGLSSMTYDTAGHLTGMTDSNFDSAGRFVGTDFVSGMTYDTAGHLLTETVTHYDSTGLYAGYDNLSGMTYDTAGHLLTETDNYFVKVTGLTGTDDLSAMTYDAAGHLLTQTDQHFGASWTFLGTDYLTYTYDSAGHALTERINHFGTTGSFTGSNIDIFSYNSAEQLITWTSWAYNSSGLAYKDVYGNVQPEAIVNYTPGSAITSAGWLNWLGDTPPAGAMTHIESRNFASTDQMDDHEVRALWNGQWVVQNEQGSLPDCGVIASVDAMEAVTGKNWDTAQVLAVATANSWYSASLGGMYDSGVVDLIQYYGVKASDTLYNDTSTQGLQAQVNAGKSIIVAVSLSDMPEFGESGYHYILYKGTETIGGVTYADITNGWNIQSNTTQTIGTDPTNAYPITRIPLAQFLKAWADDGDGYAVTVG